METTVLLKRVAKRETYTIGHVYINTEDVRICDSLEDKVRDVNNDGDFDEPGEAKVWGETAIPCGTYKMTKEIHPKFGRCFRVYNVPHFEGIFIHAGNYPPDTHGCPLMGYNTVKGGVMNSRPALDKLWNLVPNGKPLFIKVYE